MCFFSSPPPPPVITQAPPSAAPLEMAKAPVRQAAKKKPKSTVPSTAASVQDDLSIDVNSVYDGS